MKFNYKGLYKKLTETFVFGDNAKSKCKEIGITTYELSKLKEGLPISIESLLCCLKYLQDKHMPNVPIGRLFAMHLSDTYENKADQDL